MRRFLWALIFIFCGLFNRESWSQTNTLNDTLVIQNMLANLKQLINSNLDSTLLLSKEIEEKAAEINYQNGIWDAQIYRGRAFSDLGQSDSAEAILTKVIRETKMLGIRLEEIKAHQDLAYVQQQNYNFQSAIDHLIQAQKLLKDTDPFDIRFTILNTLASTHRKMKDYTGALKYFNELENNFFYQMDTLQRYALYQNKGNVYAVMEEFDKTEEFFKKAYDEIKKVNSPANLASITYNLGALCYKQKRYPEAEEYTQEALKSYNTIGNQVRIEMCYRVLGAICRGNGEFLEANKYFEKSLEIAKKINNPRALLANYQSLYYNYWNLGYKYKSIDYMDRALNYYQKYSLFNDSIYKASTASKILELEKQYETEKKNTQITLLEKENQHQEDQLLVQRAHRNYLIMIYRIG